MKEFIPKSPEELENQINTVSTRLQESISLPSGGKDVLDMSLSDIKEVYPERYQAYLKVLREIKNGSEMNALELESIKIWIRALNGLDSYIDNHSESKESIDAREKRQFNVFEDIRDSLEQGKIEGYIKLPTGVGKTVLFSRVIESLKLKTFVVVPSKILVNQTVDKFEKFTNVQPGKYFQGEKNLNEDVTVTTYSSLIRGINSGKIDPKNCGALILDEAHKSLGEETVKVIDQFNCVKLGFTATPNYSKDKKVSNILENEIHSMTVAEATLEKLISRHESYVAYTKVDMSSVNINKNEYDPKTLEEIVNEQGRNQAAVNLYKNKFDGQLAITYCSGVTHATKIAEMFNSSGVKAEVISGETPDKDKKNILEEFKKGNIKVLCNARILIEGFDEPKASVCLNLHPTLSRVDAEQRAGRVLRIDPDNPQKCGYIIDFIDRNPKVPPITFVEIVKEAEIEFNDRNSDTNANSQDKEGGAIRDNFLEDIVLDGLIVVIDPIKVLSIGNEFEEQRNISQNIIDGEINIDGEKFMIKSKIKHYLNPSQIKLTPQHKTTRGDILYNFSNFAASFLKEDFSQYIDKKLSIQRVTRITGFSRSFIESIIEKYNINVEIKDYWVKQAREWGTSSQCDFTDILTTLEKEGFINETIEHIKQEKLSVEAKRVAKEIEKINKSWNDSTKKALLELAKELDFPGLVDDTYFKFVLEHNGFDTQDEFVGEPEAFLEICIKRITDKKNEEKDRQRILEAEEDEKKLAFLDYLLRKTNVFLTTNEQEKLNSINITRDIPQLREKTEKLIEKFSERNPKFITAFTRLLEKLDNV